MLSKLLNLKVIAFEPHPKSLPALTSALHKIAALPCITLLLRRSSVRPRYTSIGPPGLIALHSVPRCASHLRLRPDQRKNDSEPAFDGRKTPTKALKTPWRTLAASSRVRGINLACHVTRESHRATAVIGADLKGDRRREFPRDGGETENLEERHVVLPRLQHAQSNLF